MERIPFDQWWAEFSHERRGDRDSGYRAVQDLVRLVRRLEPGDRRSFLDELVSVALGGGSGAAAALEESVAAAALEECAEAPQIEALCAHLSPLPNPASQDEEWRLASLLRVSAADPQQACSDPVEEFLLRRDITAYWSSVPWALWPHNAELFVRAWTRYFSTQPPAVWTGTAVVQAFLDHPDAITELEKELAFTDRQAWKVLSSSLRQELEKASWLHEDTRAQLDLVLGEPAV